MEQRKTITSGEINGRCLKFLCVGFIAGVLLMVIFNHYYYAERKLTDTTSSGYVATDSSLKQEISETVYVTRSGKKYHSAGCRYLRNSKIPMSKDKAKAKGYSPCSQCSP